MTEEKYKYMMEKGGYSEEEAKKYGELLEKGFSPSAAIFIAKGQKEEPKFEPKVVKETKKFESKSSSYVRTPKKSEYEKNLEKGYTPSEARRIETLKNPPKEKTGQEQLEEDKKSIEEFGKKYPNYSDLSYVERQKIMYEERDDIRKLREAEKQYEKDLESYKTRMEIARIKEQKMHRDRLTKAIVSKKVSEQLKNIKIQRRPYNPLAGLAAPRAGSAKKPSIQVAKRVNVQPKFVKVQPKIEYPQPRIMPPMRIEPQRQVKIAPHNDDRGYVALFGSEMTVNPRTQEVHREYNPVNHPGASDVLFGRKSETHPMNSEDANHLVDMGFGGENPLTAGNHKNLTDMKRKRINNDPTGAGSFW